MINLNLLPLSMFFAFLGMVIGLLIFFKTALLIQMQINFYKRINWHMAPISMPKEIKNTRLMGLLLFAFCVFSIVYVKLFLK